VPCTARTGAAAEPGGDDAGSRPAIAASSACGAVIRWYIYRRTDSLRSGSTATASAHAKAGSWREAATR
jgi:hypothetical protein